MKRIIAYIVFFTLLLHGKLSFAQKPTNFGIRDGLPSNHVYKVAQDSEGFIWILTDNGLVKFDGDSFKEFTIKEGLPSNDIWELASSPDGKVWFFSKGSQVGYIYKDMVYSYGGEDASVFFHFGLLKWVQMSFLRVTTNGMAWTERTTGASCPGIPQKIL